MCSPICRFHIERIIVGMEDLLLRVAEAAKLVSISRSSVYELIARNEIPAARIGGSWRIPTQALSAWLQQKRIDQTTVEPRTRHAQRRT
jgi:excisionase family DNA binding protein